MRARLVLAGSATALAMSELTAQPVRYPPTRADTTADAYHGTRVNDPYRWLEALDAKETGEWVAAQNAVTFRYLEQLPAREVFRRRMTTLWNYPRVGVPQREAGQLFFSRNTGLQRQSVIFRQRGSTEPVVLLDPNTFSPDGSIAMSGYAVSPDGRYVAYGRSEGGADWSEYRVREIANGRELADRVQWMKFSGASWTKDGKGFFYSRYPTPPEGKALQSAALRHQLYYHVAGTPQAQDRLIFEMKDRPDWIAFGSVTEDGRYLLIYAVKGTDPKNELHIADLGDPKRPNLAAPVRPLIPENDASYVPVGNIGSRLFVQTDLDAPRRRVVALDIASPSRDRWKAVIPQADEPLEAVALVGGRLVANYLDDVKSQVAVFDTTGRRVGELPLPGVGTLAGLSGRADNPELFYAFTSFLFPTTVYRYDVRTGTQTVFAKPELPADPSQFETKQVFYTSKDGTRVPMFINARKGIKLDGTNPTLMYAYGGFSATMQPFFTPSVLAWLEAGGVYAVPNLRGGGEYGEEWHRAGMFEKKQNVFDDFIAAAEYLIREQYTSPAKLAISGASNGGLLVGAVMTQRPELFAVALPQVGVLDMLRYHKFSAGVFWATEYGSSDDPKQFNYLKAYSPLHNLRAGRCYPATLVTTADHDDRVVPSHSFKFTAALQTAQGCDRPTLIRVETQGSHGYRPTDKLIAEAADQMAFTAANLGLKVTGPVP